MNFGKERIAQLQLPDPADAAPYPRLLLEGRGYPCWGGGYRDHGWYFDNNHQMDICIPIRQRDEAKRRSQEKGKILWAREMKRRKKI